MKSKRIVWMDIARVLAVIMVVSCHVIEIEYYDVIFGKKSVPDLVWFFENILYAASRFGVPLFLMLSGALLLERDIEINVFYKHSLIPLLITTEVWTIIYYFYNIWAAKSAFNVQTFLYDALFLKNSSANHMWYLPMILGFYLIMPFLSKALKSVSFSAALIPLSIAFFAFSIIPLFNAFASEVFKTLPDITFSFDVAFLGGVYGFLLVMGHYVTHSPIFKKIPFYVFIVVLLVSLAFNTIGARYFYTHNLYHSIVFVWYNSPFIIVASVCLFACLSKLKIKRSATAATILSKGSFTIYLIHNMILNYVESNLNFYRSYPLIARTVIRFAFAFGLPALLVILLNFTPFRRFKKTVFYMK